MFNPIDYTFKKILKVARALAGFRALSFLVGGILILVLNQKIESYIYLIVAINLILVSTLNLMQEIVDRSYRLKTNHIGTNMFTIAVAILILTQFHDDIYRVSIMWAVATVVNSTMEINEGLHELHERKAFSIINLIFSTAEIVFSILLLVEPEENAEHFLTHIYLLGAGFILGAAEELLGMISPYLSKVPVVNFIPTIQKMADERKEEKKEIEEAKLEEEKLKEKMKKEREEKKTEKEINQNK